MSQSTNPKRNRLLAALDAADWARWSDRVEEVVLAPNQVLHECGGTQTHVYFPTTAIIALQSVMENDVSTQLALVGNEGFTGIAICMGASSTQSRAVVQIGGAAFRLSGDMMKDEFDRAPVRQLMLIYAQALITQLSLAAACNRHHSLEQQLSRWLLHSWDRTEDGEIHITQERTAALLGVRREGVSKAAAELKRAGIIRYARGRLRLKDRVALEGRSCQCYSVIKRECDNALAQLRDATVYVGMPDGPSVR